MKNIFIFVYFLTFLTFLHSEAESGKMSYSAQQWLEKGNSYYLKRKFFDAIDCYTEAIEINPDFAEAYYNRGRSYQYINKHEKAIEDFAVSAKLDKKYQNILSEI